MATKLSIQIRIEPQVLDAIDLRAEETDRSRSWTINDLLKTALNIAPQPDAEASQHS